MKVNGQINDIRQSGPRRILRWVTIWHPQKFFFQFGRNVRKISQPNRNFKKKTSNDWKVQKIQLWNKPENLNPKFANWRSHDHFILAIDEEVNINCKADLNHVITLLTIAVKKLKCYHLLEVYFYIMFPFTRNGSFSKARVQIGHFLDPRVDLASKEASDQYFINSIYF